MFKTALNFAIRTKLYYAIPAAAAIALSKKVTQGFLPTHDQLVNDKIIGDVVDDFYPKFPLDITYVDQMHTIHPGETISADIASRRPKLNYKGEHFPKIPEITEPIISAEPKFYTLLMVDPDAPKKEYVHWFVVNIVENYIKRGKVIKDYVPPSPPKGSGTHRYVFLLFEHNKLKDFGDINKESLVGWNTREFAKKYELGDPVAVNYFKVKG